MAALQAIESFDDSRSDSITVHIWAQLQYAILAIKRRHKPHGFTAVGLSSPVVWSLEFSEEFGYQIAADSPEEDLLREKRLRQALSRLEPSERHAVILYLDGIRPRRKVERNMLNAAMDKLREFYLALQCTAEPAL